MILAVIGAVLIHAQVTAAINLPLILLAIGAAASLAIVEVIYVTKRGISRVYPGDAAAEIILMVWWVLALFA